MPIPDDRCERCTAPLVDGDVWTADRDRVCGSCADRARGRGETVELVDDDVCAVCHGEPLAPVEGPDGKLWPRVCGACTPPP